MIENNWIEALIIIWSVITIFILIFITFDR